MWARSMLVAVVAVLGLPGAAAAHDYAHPELKSWFMGLHNQNGGPCCDGEDATHLEDQDWDTACDDKGCHYRVSLEGRWYNVPDWAVVIGPNKAGTALVWPVRQGGLGGKYEYAIRCFMPGSGT